MYNVKHNQIFEFEFEFIQNWHSLLPGFLVRLLSLILEESGKLVLNFSSSSNTTEYMLNRFSRSSFYIKVLI